MANVISFVEELKKQFPQKLPPVHLWNPPLSGDMDMRITTDGTWFHEGDEIKRKSLAKLFSTILKKENNDYFLVTPVEKWRIEVEVAPFVIVSCDLINSQSLARSKVGMDGNETGAEAPVLCLTTNMDDKIFVGKDNPIWVEMSDSFNHSDPAEGPLPFVLVRDNLPGLINRNVYYQLVELAIEESGSESGGDDGYDGANGEVKDVFVMSGSSKFSLTPRTK